MMSIENTNIGIFKYYKKLKTFVNYGLLENVDTMKKMGKLHKLKENLRNN